MKNLFILKSLVLLLTLGGLAACNDSRLSDLSRIPASVTITVNPPRGDFRVGDDVLLGAVVLDENGIVLEGVQLTWQVPPADQVSEALTGQGVYTFLQPGTYTWTVGVVEYPALTDSVTLSAATVPATVEITVDPQQAYYAPGDQVALDYVVTDENGIQMTGIAAAWQVPDPADVADLGQGSYRFGAEGAYTWTVTLEAPWGLSDSVTLQVDGQGPVLDLTSPERGDTLLKDTPDPEVPVQGSVSDSSSGLASLSVRSNTQLATEVQVRPNGTFTSLVLAEPGLNFVVIEAIDQAGNSSLIERAFLYAPDYFAWQGDVAGRERVSKMEDALLTDLALDRGRPFDNPSYDPCSHDANDDYTCSEIRDVASLLELALNNLDFTQLADQLNFHFPLLDEMWTLDLLGFAEVSLRLEGYFDLDFAFSQISVGEAKVMEFSSYQAGIQSDTTFSPWTDSQGVTHPGLSADLGMTGTLQFSGWLDLTAPDQATQDILCFLALNICNPNPPFDCLYEYLVSCNPVATPVASITSVIQTPVLAGLDVDQMQMQADLLVSLDAVDEMPQVDLANLTLAIGQGALDVSALEDLTINLGTVQFASYQLDLGTYEFPLGFISDLADQLLDPMLNALIPLIEPVLGQIFRCNDPNNPLCFVIPFLEHLLGAFAFDADLDVPDPFGAAGDVLTTVHARTGFEEVLFRTGFGGWLTLDGRIDAEPSSEVLNHSDDDMLGVALLGGCLEPDAGFSGHPTGGRALQLAQAITLYNQMAYAVWRSGGSDFDLDQTHFELDPQAGVSGLTLSVRPWLPVTLNHCVAAAGQLGMQWGDLALSIDFVQAGVQLSAELFASISIPGTLESSADGRVTVALSAEADWLEVEFTSLSADGQALALDAVEAEAIRSLLGDELLPQLLTRLNEASLDPLSALSPEFDISDFPGIAPGQAVLSIGDLDAILGQGRAILNGEFVQ